MSNDFRTLRYSSVVSFSSLVSAGGRGCQRIVTVGIGWEFSFDASRRRTRRTHGYVPAALADLALGLPFATPRPRFVAWNESVTFAGAMVLVPRVESATKTELQVITRFDDESSRREHRPPRPVCSLGKISSRERGA